MEIIYSILNHKIRTTKNPFPETEENIITPIPNNKIIGTSKHQLLGIEKDNIDSIPNRKINRTSKNYLVGREENIYLIIK